MEWISVNKNSPQEMEDILILFNGNQYCVGYRVGNKYYIEDASSNGVTEIKADITHWMELPNPPKTD